MSKKSMSLLAMTILLFSLSALAEPVHLTILHFNDLHGHVEQAARMAAKIKEISAGNEAAGYLTLVLNGGDLVSGTPVSARFKGKAEAAFLNYIGNDAFVPGNHDFDFGLEAFEKNIADYKFPTVAGNVLERKTGKPFFTNDTIVTLPIKSECSGDCFADARNDISLKIGVFGLAHPQTPTLTDPNNTAALKFTSPISAAKKAMNKLEGATDIQVALTHEGVKNDIRLAKEVKGIDAIVGGHDHVKPAEYCRDAEGVPVCQTPANGAYLGRIDLVIDNGHVVSSKEALIPIDKDIKPDNGLKEKLRPFLSAVEREMKEVLGAAVKDYPHQRGSATSPLGLLITTVIKDETGADIGFMNAGGIRQGLKKGEITRGEIEEILPFPNEVVVVEMRGAELKALLDRLEKAGKSAQLSGIAGADGLAPDKLYKVATSSFLSNGGDGCEALKKARLVKNTKIYIKDMVAGYIEREKKI